MNITIGITFSLFSMLAIAFMRSFFRIEEGHKALLTTFGQLKTQNGKTKIFSSGLHSKLPWQKVHEFSVMEKIMNIREDGRELELLARDGTLLRMTPLVRFKFRETDAESFIFGIQSPLSHLRELFRSIMSNEVARFGKKDNEDGSYAEIRRNRNRLNEMARTPRLNDFWKKYGVDLQSVDVTEILPPADLARALNSVQKVEAEYETLLKRVQAECEQQVSFAHRSVEIAKTRAEALETEINVMGETVENLKRDGTLASYVKRRQDEAAAGSKTLYMKSLDTEGMTQ